MTIIFPECDCGRCWGCYERKWLKAWKDQKGMIVSHHRHGKSQHYPGVAYDQKKSLLKKEHDTRMREAFLYGRQR